MGLLRTADGPKGIHDYDTRIPFLDLCGDLLQDLPQSFFENRKVNRDKAETAIDFGRIEKCELLLIPEELDGRLAQYGDVQGYLSEVSEPTG